MQCRAPSCPPRRPPWQLPRWPPRRSPSLSPCRHSHIKLWCVLDGVKTWRTEQPTDKAILGVGYRVILLTGPVGIQCALPKSCQESCSYHTNHSWNMLNRFLCNMCRCGIQCAIPKRCQKSCSSPHSSHHSYNMLKRFLSTMCRCRILCDIPKRLQKSCIYHTNHN